MYFEPVVLPFVEVDFIELFLQKPFTQIPYLSYVYSIERNPQIKV